VSASRPTDEEIKAFYEDFGACVRRHRGSMSQADIGSRVGLSRGSISNIEAGRQHVPLHLLPLLAQTLGVEPAELIAPLKVGHDVDVSGLGPDERQFVANVIAAARGQADDDKG
jgi:transcriptional regulator with XRE-family HTH domain